jgi:hypothetical protein
MDWGGRLRGVAKALAQHCMGCTSHFGKVRSIGVEAGDACMYLVLPKMYQKTPGAVVQAVKADV